MKTTMQLLACFLSVGSVVGLSVASPRAAFEIPDHGDGLYVVQVDESNIPVGVQFTALADVTTGAAVDSTDTTLVPRNALDKRAGITCSGQVGNTDIDSAQGCLAGGVSGSYGKGQWLYCKAGTAVAYACNYQVNALNYNIIANMIQGVDTNCGNYGYGYNRCTNGCSVYDLAVGRARNGDEFCSPGFRG